MDIEVTIRGAVTDAAKQAARDKIARLENCVNLPLLGARVVLTQERNPRIDRPARAEGELSLNGSLVRGHVAAETMSASVDELHDHLQRQLRNFVDRLVTRHRRSTHIPDGKWRHGLWSPTRPNYFPRPVSERRVVRRKTFALGPMSVAEAASDLQALDHEFFLFVDEETGADSVIFRRDDGLLAVIEPRDITNTHQIDQGPMWQQSRFSEPINLSDAIAEMDTLNHRFLYFENSCTARANVIYLRYDGHYGVIEPSF
jgi:ribosomal subunit interface protein